MFRKLLEVLSIYSLCSMSAFSGEFTFKKKLMEVTAKPDVEVVHVRFPFQNNSDETVTIHSFDAPCSCMEARIVRPNNKNSLVFAPGEKGIIIGVLEFGKFKGTIDKVITIFTDKKETKESAVVLTSRVTIPVLISTDKNRLDWDVGSKLEPKEFRIKVSEESQTPIKIVNHGFSFNTGKVFDYKIEPIKEGREYKVTVTPLTTDEGSVAVVKFTTDSKIPRYQMVQAFLYINHPKK